MDRTCTICFDEMDMNAYQDDRESTSTCFKLECNHAFHTKCIIECLQKTRHKCPSCNQEKTFSETLNREGIFQELIDDIKKAEPVREKLQEYSIAKRELDETVKAIQQEVKDFANQRKLEHKYIDKKRYVFQCIADVKRAGIREAKTMSPRHRAIVTEGSAFRRISKIDLSLIGLHKPYQLYRLRHPSVMIRL